MSFEGMRLRDLTVEDIRQIVSAGVAEHLYLEYKQEVYSNNHESQREFLLDVCMFANAQGGVLLIGIPEQRDSKGHATGLPDPNGELGVRCENPELLLQAYDGRIASCIEERLPIELHAIQVADGRYVLALRIPDSIRKPHCVHIEHRTYFPIRRERNRYWMDVREIKDLAMQAASQLSRAESEMQSMLGGSRIPSDPTLIMVLVPVFFRDFLVEVKKREVRTTLATFHLHWSQDLSGRIEFNLIGLRRLFPADPQHQVTLQRNGILTMNVQLPWHLGDAQLKVFALSRVDAYLRIFAKRAQILCAAAEIPGPILLGASIHTPKAAAAIPLRAGGVLERQIGPGCYPFPPWPLGNMSGTPEEIVRPLCDVVHQMFNEEESPCFASDGTWQGPTD